MPAALQAATSMTALRGPVVTSRRRFGSRSRASARERRAFPHGDHDLEGPSRRRRVLVVEVIGEDVDVDPPAGGPVGVPGDALVVVEDRSPADRAGGHRPLLASVLFVSNALIGISRFTDVRGQESHILGPRGAPTRVCPSPAPGTPPVVTGSGSPHDPRTERTGRPRCSSRVAAGGC